MLSRYSRGHISTTFYAQYKGPALNASFSFSVGPSKCLRSKIGVVINRSLKSVESVSGIAGRPSDGSSSLKIVLMGAAMQASAAEGSLTGITPEGDVLRVREVWQDNLEVEMQLIRDILDEHPYLAMDTEFPGVVARPTGRFLNSGEYHYQTLRLNVDMLKLIQLGLTFTDEKGNLPRINGELCVWQFNFREFRPSEDVFAPDSIELLRASGIDFAQNETRGIDVRAFGELLTVSGIVLNEDVNWITFHSGYDFGYLLKVLTCAPLPHSEDEFFDILKTFFPCIYDIKYLMKFCDSLHGGLNKLAETLDVARIGPQHQAGSDSLLTSAAFLTLAGKYFKGVRGVEAHCGVLYGLGSDGNNQLAEGD